jgi:hypothetical protein
MPAREKTPNIADLGEINSKRRSISLELAQEYADKHVAWDLKGEKILAAGENLDDVEEQLIKMGIDPSQVVFGYVDPPGTAWMG